MEAIPLVEEVVLNMIADVLDGCMVHEGNCVDVGTVNHECAACMDDLLELIHGLSGHPEIRVDAWSKPEHSPYWLVECHDVKARRGVSGSRPRCLGRATEQACHVMLSVDREGEAGASREAEPTSVGYAVIPSTWYGRCPDDRAVGRCVLRSSRAGQTGG